MTPPTRPAARKVTDNTPVTNSTGYHRSIGTHHGSRADQTSSPGRSGSCRPVMATMLPAVGTPSRSAEHRPSPHRRRSHPIKEGSDATRARACITRKGSRRATYVPARAGSRAHSRSRPARSDPPCPAWVVHRSEARPHGSTYKADVGAQSAPDRQARKAHTRSPTGTAAGTPAPHAGQLTTGRPGPISQGGDTGSNPVGGAMHESPGHGPLAAGPCSPPTL